MENRVDDESAAPAGNAGRTHGPVELRAEAPWGRLIMLTVPMSVGLIVWPWVAITHPESNAWQGALVTYGLYAAIGAIPFRFRVIIDEKVLRYRFYFFWKQIRLDQIKVINKDCKGISLGPSNQFAYQRSLFVHAKPGSGAKGFRLNYAPMGDEGIFQLHKALADYMPKQLRPPRPRRGKERWIPKIFWKG